MKKTYITTMPDQIGAFLKASECFASLGVNIIRVSYPARCMPETGRRKNA